MGTGRGKGVGMGAARAARGAARAARGADRAARAAKGEREHLPEHANAAARRGTTKHNVTTRTRNAGHAARSGT